MADTPSLSTLLEQYRAGLEAEIAILRRLQRVAVLQHEAAERSELEGLRAASDERDHLMAALVAIETPLRDVKVHLASARLQARQEPSYVEVLTLQSEVKGLISSILKTDDNSVEALSKAETLRRDTARAMEQGETTLAAYRRVMTATPGATLVDRRG